MRRRTSCSTLFQPRRKPAWEAPRSIDDYEEITVDEGAVPEGVTVLRMV